MEGKCVLEKFLSIALQEYSNHRGGQVSSKSIFKSILFMSASVLKVYGSISIIYCAVYKSKQVRTNIIISNGAMRSRNMTYD